MCDHAVHSKCDPSNSTTCSTSQNMAAPSKHQRPPHLQLCFSFIELWTRRCIVFPKFLCIPGSVLQEFGLLHTTFQRSSDTKCGIILASRHRSKGFWTWNQDVIEPAYLSCSTTGMYAGTAGLSNLNADWILSDLKALQWSFSTAVHKASSF